MDSDKIPAFDFFTPDRLALFWHDAAMIFRFVAPALIIYFATVYAGELLSTIRLALFPEDRENRDYEAKGYDDINKN